MSVRSCLAAAALAMLLLPTRALAGEPAQPSTERLVALEQRGTALSWDEGRRLVRHGESLLRTGDVREGLLEMLTAYVSLETSLGGPKEPAALYLRSWLVAALDIVGLVDESDWLRSRGSVVSYPLAVPPSIWHADLLADSSENPKKLSQTSVRAQTKQGFDMLDDGNLEGFERLMQLHNVGAWYGEDEEVPATVALRSHLVALFEAGGFCEMANELRQKDVFAVSERDRERYEIIWVSIASAQQPTIAALRNASKLEPERAPVISAWERRACDVPRATYFRRQLGIVAPAPVILTPFGGGSYTKAGLSVIGGDLLAGASILFVDTSLKHTLVLTPTVGWSGWRTLDKPASLRANTFTGRLDFGYMNFRYWQGITVFGAGRIGTGRGPERDRDPTMLYGAQVGVTYWPVTGWQPHAGILGLEVQSNYTNYLGEWHNDLRFMLTLNFSVLFVPVTLCYGLCW